MQWTPEHYQHRALEFGLSRTAAALFLKPGLGKTSVALTIIYALRKQAGVKKTLIVAPLRVCYQVWPREIAKWDHTKDLKSVILHGKGKTEENAAGPYDISIINPQGLEWFFSLPAKIVDQYDVLVVDESTMFKNGTSQRTKLIHREAGRFSYRYILTGTPMPRVLENVWSQVRILDGGQRLGRFVTHFRRQYMVDVAPRHATYSVWEAAPGAHDEVFAKISDIAITMSDADYVGAQPMRENVITVTMPASARKVYNQMANQAVADVKSGKVAAANAAGVVAKLQQVTAGFIYDEDRNATELHEAKLAALVELVDGLQGAPLLVGIKHRYEYDMIASALVKAGFPKPPYWGGGGSKDTQGDIDRWNAGKINVIVANPAAAGHGIDGLQERGTDVCFFSLQHDYELVEQLSRRVRRTGQKSPTVMHIIEAEESIDAEVRKVVTDRDNRQSRMFDVLKSLTKE